jgi:TetR/AcrR family transcriptional regulator, cholesterol catabolism regulator
MTSASREPTGRRGSDRSEATRAALVELAGELFATRGYAQTSMRDIAREGPVSMGAIYLHFKNKAELLVEALETKIHDELEGPVDDARPADHVEQLMRDALDVTQRRDLRALLVQAAAASQTDEETRARVRDAQQAHIDDWVARYEANRARLEFDEDLDIATAARYLWAAELGLGMLEAFGMGDVDPRAWADMLNRVGRSLRLPHAS